MRGKGVRGCDFQARPRLDIYSYRNYINITSSHPRARSRRSTAGTIEGEAPEMRRQTFGTGAGRNARTVGAVAGETPRKGFDGGPSRLVPAHRPCVTSGGEALDPTSQRGQCLIGQPTGGQSEQASSTARGIAGETADLRFHQITRPGRPGPPLDREIQRSASPTWTRRPAPPRTIFYWGTGKATGVPAPAKSGRAELWMTGVVRRLEWTRAVDRAAGLAGSFASEVRMAWDGHV